MTENRIDIPKETLEQLYISKKLNGYQIARKFNCGSTTIYRRLEKHGINRRNNSESHLRYNKSCFSGDKGEAAYLIGFRLGDLHVRKAFPSSGCKTIRVEAHTTKKAQIKLLRFLFKRYTHVHCKRTSAETVRVLCFLDESFSFLLPKRDAIENWITQDKDLFLSFLAGYVDAEGHIGVHSQNKAGRLQIHTQDEGIIGSIQKNLLKIGIKSSQPRLAVPEGYTSPSYPTKPNNRIVWGVAIYMPDLKKLLEWLIPLLKHEKRKSDAIITLNHIKDGKYEK